MTREELEQFEVRVSGVNGPSGQCLYLNDHRVAGGKPWGGGVAVFEKTFKLGGFPDLMQLIDSYVEAKVLEAKIDTATDIRAGYLFAQSKPFDQWLEDRIATLQAEKENLNEQQR